MLKRLTFETREEWLAGRTNQGIGGSEASAVVGLSPWQTPVDLWKLKLGMTQPKDLSGNPAVANGVVMEPILRDFFTALHPEFAVEHHPYDILFQEERPELFATLDGELTDERGRHGVLEIKTATPIGNAWSEWKDGNMKPTYYVQVIHQLLATGYDFVRLFACLYSQNGDMTIKEYEIERSDVEDDLAWLLEKEITFWTRNVVGGVMPAVPLML